MPDNNQNIPSNHLNDVLTLLGGGGTAGLASKAIVPTAFGRLLSNPNRPLKLDPKISSQLESQGALVSPEGIHLHLNRYQNPAQAGQPAMGGGVYYTPNKAGRLQGGNELKNEYLTPDTNQSIKGYTWLNNPYISYSRPGASTVQQTLDDFLPYGVKGAMGDAKAAQRAFSYLGRQDDIDAFLLDRLKGPFNKPSPEVLKANQDNIAPWLMQSLASDQVRNHGYDSILNFHRLKDYHKPRVSEVFDLRENTYPTPEGDFSTWPQYDPLNK